MYTKIAPIRNLKTIDSPWEGLNSIKPWDYKVTAVVPVIDTYESLSICIATLRLQTVKPYIIIIDTGSEPGNYKRIETMRSEDLEVHSIKLNGVKHPSDFVAMAMDLAQTLCRTEYLFATHSDVFLKRKDLLESMMAICGSHLENKEKYPVVGYEISPRQHDDWIGMVSHTASMYYMKIMDQIGFGWSIRRLASIYELEDYRPDPMRPNWPDTEILGNVILRQNNIPVKLIGKEKNFQRNTDDNIDHCRSITSGLLYSPEYFKKAQEWYEDAKKEALTRIEVWKKEANEQ